jgi:hypothetical protein
MSDIKPILPSEKPAPVADILEEQAGDSMDKAPKAQLVNVKYINVLPDQKTSGYLEQQKCQFTIPSDVGYFDPKQSYLNVVIRPTSGYLPSVLTGLTGVGSYPCCLPPNVGAHSLFSRVQLQSADGKTIEDVDAYNLFVSLLKSYGHDDDELQTLSMIEGVSAHNNLPENRGFGDPAVNYFLPPYETDASGDLSVAMDTYFSRAFQIPLHLGTWCGIEKSRHQVYPNLNIGGTLLTLFFDRANHVLTDLASAFTPLVDEAEELPYVNYVSAQTAVACSDISGTSPIDHVLIDEAVCDTTVSLFDLTKIVYQPGVVIGVSIDSNPVVYVVITTVEKDQGLNSNQVKINFSPTITYTGATTPVSLVVAPPAHSFVVDKIELKLLETMPDAGTINRIAKQMSSQGMTFTSVTCNKLSTPAQLQNAVVNVPNAFTRAQSILAVPVQSSLLNVSKDTNSYIYPQVDDNNQYKYQWQVSDTLIPNREIQTNTSIAATCDNTIHFNMLTQAFRPILTVKSYNQGLWSPNRDERRILTNPFCYPLPLAPSGGTYNTLNTELQLRQENEDAANTSSKLYHVYTLHTRSLQTPMSSPPVVLI